MLTKPEKELLEDLMDELYEDFETYQKTLKPGEQMNVTYELFLSIVKKLGLREPRQQAPRQASSGKPQAKEQRKPGPMNMKPSIRTKPNASTKRPPSK
ncbi:hypothetical protein [Brevibacillus migulae]|uniref:hypothetical protein n=1 Tax=Brevibacillus migulae TaxID=1644114 RepID=UPI00106DEF1B|nr:hypothetical protein [Brevibacillus migulae]